MTTENENKNVEVLKELKQLGFNETDISDIMQGFEPDEYDRSDFTLELEEGEYRFIHEDVIDNTLKEELSDDTYILGCFRAWFIADILNISVDSVEKIQKAEGYEALGELMLKHIDEVAEKFVSCDGYGVHFNRCNHDEDLLSNGYYMFQVN